jgi:hypothetical protein
VVSVTGFEPDEFRRKFEAVIKKYMTSDVATKYFAEAIQKELSPLETISGFLTLFEDLRNSPDHYDAGVLSVLGFMNAGVSPNGRYCLFSSVLPLLFIPFEVVITPGFESAIVSLEDPEFKALLKLFDPDSPDASLVSSDAQNVSAVAGEVAHVQNSPAAGAAEVILGSEFRTPSARPENLADTVKVGTGVDGSTTETNGSGDGGTVGGETKNGETGTGTTRRQLDVGATPFKVGGNAAASGADGVDMTSRAPSVSHGRESQFQKRKREKKEKKDEDALRAAKIHQAEHRDDKPTIPTGADPLSYRHTELAIISAFIRIYLHKLADVAPRDVDDAADDSVKFRPGHYSIADFISILEMLESFGFSVVTTENLDYKDSILRNPVGTDLLFGVKETRKDEVKNTRTSLGLTTATSLVSLLDKSTNILELINEHDLLRKGMEKLSFGQGQVTPYLLDSTLMNCSGHHKEDARASVRQTSGNKNQISRLKTFHDFNFLIVKRLYMLKDAVDGLTPLVSPLPGYDSVDVHGVDLTEVKSRLVAQHAEFNKILCRRSGVNDMKELDILAKAITDHNDHLRTLCCGDPDGNLMIVPRISRSRLFSSFDFSILLVSDQEPLTSKQIRDKMVPLLDRMEKGGSLSYYEDLNSVLKNLVIHRLNFIDFLLNIIPDIRRESEDSYKTMIETLVSVDDLGEKVLRDRVVAAFVSGNDLKLVKSATGIRLRQQVLTDLVSKSSGKKTSKRKVVAAAMDYKTATVQGESKNEDKNRVDQLSQSGIYKHLKQTLEKNFIGKDTTGQDGKFDFIHCDTSGLSIRDIFREGLKSASIQQKLPAGHPLKLISTPSKGDFDRAGIDLIVQATKVAVKQSMSGTSSNSRSKPSKPLRVKGNCYKWQDYKRCKQGDACPYKHI